MYIVRKGDEGRQKWGLVHARRTLKGLVADLRKIKKGSEKSVLNLPSTPFEFNYLFDEAY